MAFYGKGRARTGGERPGRRQAAHPRHRRPWPLVVGAARQGHARSKDEFGFAASGDCLVTSGRSAFLITGGEKSRVMRSDDRGRTWTAVASGIPAGEAAGGFAGAFASPRLGIAVGGDFAEADDTEERRPTPATAGPGPAADLSHVGEDVAYLRGRRYAVATGDYDGSIGSSITTDGGRTWKRVSEGATTPSSASARSAGPPAARAASATTDSTSATDCHQLADPRELLRVAHGVDAVTRPSSTRTRHHASRSHRPTSRSRPGQPLIMAGSAVMPGPRRVAMPRAEEPAHLVDPDHRPRQRLLDAATVTEGHDVGREHVHQGLRGRRCRSPA